MPVLALLGAVLVILKALGYIALPWVWVLAPFWIGLAIALVMLAVFAAFAITAALVGR